MHAFAPIVAGRVEIHEHDEAGVIKMGVLCVNVPRQKRTVSVYIFTLARQEAGKWAVRFPLILRGAGVTSPELRQQKKPIAKVVGRGPTDDTALYRREEGRESASQKQTPCRACVYVTPKLRGGFVPARMTLHFFLLLLH